MPSGYKGTYEGIAGGSMARAWESLSGYPAAEKKIAKDPGAPVFTVDPAVKKSQDEAIARGEMVQSPWDGKLVAGIKITRYRPATLNSIAATHEMDPEVIRSTNMSTFEYAVRKSSRTKVSKTRLRGAIVQDDGRGCRTVGALGAGRIQLRQAAWDGADTGRPLLAKVPAGEAAGEAPS